MNVSAMHIYDIFCNRQPQSRTAGCGRAGMFDPIKLIKQKGQVFFRYYICLLYTSDAADEL